MAFLQTFIKYILTMRGIQKSDLKVIPCKQEYQRSMTPSTKNSMALFSLKKMNSFILRIRNIKFCWCLGRIKTTKVLKVHEHICQEVDGSSCTFIKWIQSMKYLKNISHSQNKWGGNMSRVHEFFYRVFETFSIYSIVKVFSKNY